MSGRRKNKILIIEPIGLCYIITATDTWQWNIVKQYCVLVATHMRRNHNAFYRNVSLPQLFLNKTYP